MKKSIRILAIVILFSFLFLIRAFETSLYYDPLIIYFQNDYLYQPIPEIDAWELIINMFFRYSLNSIISLSIIYLTFRNKNYLKFSGFFLMTAFMVLILFYGILLKDQFESGYLLPFYIRRFIIHPIFLFLLLPAFYLQKKKRRVKI